MRDVTADKPFRPAGVMRDVTADKTFRPDGWCYA
jgi:hypothetical protein